MIKGRTDDERFDTLAGYLWEARHVVQSIMLHAIARGRREDKSIFLFPCMHHMSSWGNCSFQQPCAGSAMTDGVLQVKSDNISSSHIRLNRCKNG